MLAAGLVSGVVSGVVSPTMAAAADGPPNPPNPLSAPNGGVASQGVKAGYLQGSAAVGASGAFSYSIPLDVPAGRAGMAPSLALQYSSAAGDGVFGLGWSLAGMSSAVGRCGSTIDTEGKRSGVHYDMQDRFCLNGQKLVLISGEYGKDGSEYRTENDAIAKVKAVVSARSDAKDGPDKFIVFAKNGHILTYEAHTTAREVATAATLGDTGVEYTAAPGTTSTPRASWVLASEADRSGNEITYTYASASSALGDEYLLDQIQYTFKAGISTSRKVKFVYEDRPEADRSSGFAGGVRFGRTKRVKEIQMWAPNPGATELVRSYKLSYLPVGEGAGERKRSLLREVKEVGAKGGSLLAKQFTWSQSANPTFTPVTTLGGSGITLEKRPENQTWEMPGSITADLDNDGTDDLIYSTGGANARHFARFSTRNAQGIPDALGTIVDLDTHGWPSATQVQDARAVDVDGDGKTEIITRQQLGATVGRYDLIETWDKATGKLKHLGAGISDDAVWSDFSDVNGDGLADYVAGVPTDTTDDNGNPTKSYTDLRLEMRLNTGGGTFGNPVSVIGDVNAACEHHFTDVDGDGRADIVIDNGSNVTFGDDSDPIHQCGTGVSTNAYSYDPSNKIIQRSDIGTKNVHGAEFPVNAFPPSSIQNYEYSTGLYSHWDGVSREPDGKEKFSFTAAQINNPLFGLKSFPGDFNGDGLVDTLLVPQDLNSSTEGKKDNTFARHAAVLWNTGAGQYWDGTKVEVDVDDLADVRVGDVNGDGRADIVTFTRDGLTLDRKSYLVASDDEVIPGNGVEHVNVYTTHGGMKLSKTVLDTSAGQARADVGRVMSQLGDFNGDGRLDIFKDDGGFSLLQQDASEPDRITAVSDENTAFTRQEVEYSHTWAEKPAKIADNACTGDLLCLRKGTQVVRKLTTREDSYDANRPRSVYYSYQDPVMHRRQGFLGFGTFREWDPSRPIETVTTYDVRTSSPGGKHYPFAGAPATVTVTTPVLNDAQVAAKPATAKARVTKTVNSLKFMPLNGGKTFMVRPSMSIATSADTNVAIDWNTDHVTNSGEEEHLVGSTGAPFQTVTTTNTFDDFGNQTGSKAVTTGTGKGGTTTETVDTFDTATTRLNDWLVSVPTASQVTANEAPWGTFSLSAAADTLSSSGHGLVNGDEIVLSKFSQDAGLAENTPYVVRDASANTFKLAATAGGTALDVTADATVDVTKKTASPVTRHADFLADSKGRVYLAQVEKDNPDPDMRSNRLTEFNDNGVAVRTVESAPGRPDLITHTEYDPMFTGQPDEDIYPSQVWTERADTAAAYRPSSWSAVQPAYGITVATEDINGVQSKVAFDDLGRTTQTTGDGQPTVSTSYSSTTNTAGKINGLKTTVTTATGTGTVNTSSSYTDQVGRTRNTTVTGFDGETITSTASYDRLGRAAATTRPTTTTTPGDESHTYYDTLDRVIKTVTADGKEATISYPDAFTTTSIDIAGRTTDAVVDNARRPVKAVRHYTQQPGNTPATAIATTEYGAFGLPVKSADDKGNTITTSYDLLGRPVTVTDPDRGQVTTTYYGNGLVDTLTHNGSNNTVTHTYDDLGRLIGTKHYDADANKNTTSTFVFDTASNGKGQLATASNDDDKVTTAFRYDSLGRQLGTDLTVDGSVYSSDTTYDTLGRPSTATYPQTGAGRLQLTNTYNTYGYLTDIKDTTAGAPGTPLWHASARNADLALTSAEIGPSGAIVQTNTYHPTTGRLENQSVTGTSGKLQNITYGYYDDGNLRTRTQNDPTTGKADRVESYTYDNFNRLASWSLNNNTTTPRTSTYDYDTLGNLLKVTNTGDNLPAVETRTYGRQDPKAGPHALASTTATTLGDAESYEYDKHGRLTVAKDSTGKAFRTTVYNTFDLPKTVTDKNGKTTSYLYDAFGTRVKKTAPEGTTVYAGSFEKRTTPNNEISYIQYLPGIGQAVTTNNNTTIEYTLTDKQGSTGATIDKTGNTVTNPVFYDPWGQPINASGVPQTSTPGDNTHGYTGHEMENTLRLVNMNGRTYDPAAKTFNTPDPATENHPYTYVNSNPTNFTDPTGYSPESDAILATIYNTSAIGTGQADLMNFNIAGPTANPIFGYDGNTDGFNSTLNFGNGAFSDAINALNKGIDDVSATLQDYKDTWTRFREEGGWYTSMEGVGTTDAQGRTTMGAYSTKITVGKVIDRLELTIGAVFLADDAAYITTGIIDDITAWRAGSATAVESGEFMSALDMAKTLPVGTTAAPEVGGGLWAGHGASVEGRGLLLEAGEWVTMPERDRVIHHSVAQMMAEGKWEQLGAMYEEGTAWAGTEVTFSSKPGVVYDASIRGQLDGLATHGPGAEIPYGILSPPTNAIAGARRVDKFTLLHGLIQGPGRYTFCMCTTEIPAAQWPLVKQRFGL
ncbi:SpvB/TcaC N-terminal domain-containing protein [Streptomyces sp. NPDC007355]|uniref:SpvB/TcaC N-terminal domain-containing protein n=1 Tax=Streptomyces sp. NPDC007355 TaxID=3364778 RepID=UPI0036CACE9C